MDTCSYYSKGLCSPFRSQLGEHLPGSLPCLGRGWGRGSALASPSPLGSPITALTAVDLSLPGRAPLPCTGNSLGKGCISSPALSPAPHHAWLSVRTIPSSSPSSVESSRRLTARQCAGPLLRILTAAPGSSDYVCPYFTDEETGPQKG